MKILTDDNGHVRVKSVKKDPGHDWETHIEEYDRGYALEQPQRQALQQESSQGQHQQQQQGSLQGQSAQQTLEGQSQQQLSGQSSQNLQSQQQNPQQSLQQYRSTDVMDIENDIRNIANTIKKDVESSLGQFFHRWDVFDYTPLWFDPDSTSYRMKILTDNNGHVNVRTMRKEPGQPWETRIEEFYNTKHTLGDKSQQKAVQGQTQSQTQSQSQGQSQGLGQQQERGKGQSTESIGQNKTAEQQTTTASS